MNHPFWYDQNILEIYKEKHVFNTDKDLSCTSPQQNKSRTKTNNNNKQLQILHTHLRRIYIEIIPKQHKIYFSSKLSKDKKYGLVWFFISSKTKTTTNTAFSASVARKITRFVTSNTFREIYPTEPGINYPCIKGTVFTCSKQENSFL